MKKRLFITIDFPPKIKGQIGEAVERLKKQYPEIRWEREENLHLTLKFLGWVEEDELKTQNSKVKTTGQNSKVEEIIEGMEGAVEGIKPFWFRPTKIGYFLRESLIVWLGAESQEGLFKLVDNLEKEMAKIGFSKEKRLFSPHITLGRLRHAHPILEWRRVAQELEHFPTPKFDKFQVKEIVLMESQLSRQGSTYQVLKRTPLIS